MMSFKLLVERFCKSHTSFGDCGNAKEADSQVEHEHMIRNQCTTQDINNLSQLLRTVLKSCVIVVPIPSLGKKRKLLNRFRRELAIHMMHDDTEDTIQKLSQCVSRLDNQMQLAYSTSYDTCSVRRVSSKAVRRVSIRNTGS